MLVLEYTSFSKVSFWSHTGQALPACYTTSVSLHRRCADWSEFDLMLIAVVNRIKAAKTFVPCSRASSNLSGCFFKGHQNDWEAACRRLRADGKPIRSICGRQASRWQLSPSKAQAICLKFEASGIVYQLLISWNFILMLPIYIDIIAPRIACSKE